jgi:hypothetical protein
VNSWFSVDRRFGWRDLLIVVLWFLLFVVFLSYGFHTSAWHALPLRLLGAVIFALIIATAAAALVVLIIFS